MIEETQSLGAFQRPVNIFNHLRGINSELATLPEYKRSGLAAIAIGVAIGALWWHNSRKPAIEYVDENEGEDDGDD